MVLEVGRVCIKTVGRESGKYCVVVKKPEGSFVEITGPKVLTGVKRRKSNINHLKPLEHVLEISDGADDASVVGAFEKSNLVKKFGLKKPSAAEVKSGEEEKPKAKKEKPKKEKKKK